DGRRSLREQGLDRPLVTQMGQRVAHAQNDFRHAREVLAELQDVIVDDLDLKTHGEHPQLAKQLRAIVDGEHLESPLREWNRVHAEAGAEIDGATRRMGHEAKSVQLRLTTGQSRRRSAAHPRIDRRQVSCIVIAYRLHVTPYMSASEKMRSIRTHFSPGAAQGRAR